MYKRKLRIVTSSTREITLKSEYFKMQSRILALKFGVSMKAVWNVWNRKTWVLYTSQLWQGEESDWFQGDITFHTP